MMKTITFDCDNDKLNALEDYLTTILPNNRVEQCRKDCLSLWGDLVRAYDSKDLTHSHLIYFNQLNDKIKRFLESDENKIIGLSKLIDKFNLGLIVKNPEVKFVILKFFKITANQKIIATYGYKPVDTWDGASQLLENRLAQVEITLPTKQ